MATIPIWTSIQNWFKAAGRYISGIACMNNICAHYFASIHGCAKGQKTDIAGLRNKHLEKGIFRAEK